MARWQVSQIHLAVDVANAPLALEQASRYVSRSRSRAIYEAAKAEIEQLMRAIHGPEAEEMDGLVLDWDRLYEDDTFEDLDPFDDLIQERDRDNEPTPVQDRAVTIHGFGKRISGMTFSPGGDVSMVMYDKLLQARLSGKRHMEPIWAAAGWQTAISVTRNEVRLRRRAMRELGLPNDVRSCLDDPWECLTHQKDLFNAVVGRSEACPDATDVAWIRRVIPDEQDTNQSRWPTDPVWRVMQSGTFQEVPAEARRLIRRRQRGAEVRKLDDVQFGCMISRTAKLHPEGGTWTLSRALGEVSGSLEAIEAKKTLAGKDFGELVRERRRQFGLPLPIAEKVLPFRTRPSADVSCNDGLLAGDRASAPGSRPELRLPQTHSAEGRVADAFAALQAAELNGAPRRTLEYLEEAYLTEVAVLVRETSGAQ